jgi:ubiquinone/menaquinone biosynthesis C-methylase UbiE/uncharacterized protein YbaR (Trm112 family)
MNMTIDNALLEILECPSCRGTLVVQREVLSCESCGNRYPVCDGIPDLRITRSGTEQDDFNKAQAEYEAELHDREAPSDYEETIIKVWGTKSRLMAKSWSEVITRSSTGRVLDYGCGTGQISRVFVQRFNPVYAFDISPVSVHKNVKDNGVLGCVANAFYLPFKDDAFDWVCINGVLHHIVDLPSAIQEISRVTKNNIFVSEGIPRSIPGLRRGLMYPGLLRKLLYISYVLVWGLRKTGNYCRSFLHYCLRMITLRHDSGKHKTTSPASKYERPLDAELIIDLFDSVGFTKKNLRYWTNLNYPGDGVLKRLVTSSLVNDKFGTHFDLQLVRETGDER